MLKYIGNAFQNILPSVVATVIGAYIVNTYIVSKSEAPPTAAVAPASEPRKPEESPAKAAAVEPKPSVAPAESAAGEAPAKSKAADKSDKPTRPHQPNPREKITAEKAPAKPAPVTPATVTPAAPGAMASVTTAPPAEASTTRDERRDANDLARAAIERLRNASGSSDAPRAAVEATPRLPESQRTPEPPRVQDPSRAPELPRVAAVPAAGSVTATPAVVAPVASPASVAPLPPAVTVAPPVPAAVDLTSHPTTTASVPAHADPMRPTPPAEIPGERVEASAEGGRSIRTVGDDVVSAARTVIHAVIPH